MDASVTNISIKTANNIEKDVRSSPGIYDFILLIFFLYLEFT